MTEKIVDWLLKKQIENHIISSEDEPIYRYGYILVCEVIINVFLALVIGAGMKDMRTVVAFLVIYIPLRSFCGGWHAPRLWLCTVFSNILLVVIVMAHKYLTQHFTIPVLLSIFMVCMGIILYFAPIETIAKPIDQEEERVYRKKIKIIVICHFAVGIFLIAVQADRRIFTLVSAYTTQVLMLFLGMVNREQNS